MYEALAKPTLGHLDPAFLAVMDEVREMQRAVMGTKNELTMPISGTGSAGMETCLVNLIQPGDKVLVGVNGVFGSRIAAVAPPPVTKRIRSCNVGSWCRQIASIHSHD